MMMLIGTALSLNKVGANVKYLIDLRPETKGKIIQIVKDAGIKVLFNHSVISVHGFRK